MAMMEAELAACHDKEGLRLSLERTHEREIATHLELRSALEKHLADKEAELETALERLDSIVVRGVPGSEAVRGEVKGAGVHSGKVERSYAGVNRGSVHSGDDNLHGSGAQEVSEYGGSVPGSSESGSGLTGGSEQDESVHGGSVHGAEGSESGSERGHSGAGSGRSGQSSVRASS